MLKKLENFLKSRFMVGNNICQPLFYYISNILILESITI